MNNRWDSFDIISRYMRNDILREIMTRYDINSYKKNKSASKTKKSVASSNEDKPIKSVHPDKLFSRFSMELTYMPSYRDDIEKTMQYLHFSENKKGDEEYFDFLEKIFEAHSEHIIENSSFLRKYNPYVDANSLEVRFGIFDRFKDCISEFKKLNAEMHKYRYAPSTIVWADAEGGGHLNFDLMPLYELKGKQFVNDFVKNYRNLIVKFPSVVWANLSPNDNVSSNIKFYNDIANYQKGSFFTFRFHVDTVFRNFYGSTDIPYKNCYLEMRHFMMPRDYNETKFHYDFGRAILKYVYQNPGIEVNYNNYNETLKSYTIDKAIAELKSFCQLIKFDYKRFENCGKIDILKERFVNGKDWLV